MLTTMTHQASTLGNHRSVTLRGLLLCELLPFLNTYTLQEMAKNNAFPYLPLLTVYSTRSCCSSATTFVFSGQLESLTPSLIWYNRLKSRHIERKPGFFWNNASLIKELIWQRENIPLRFFVEILLPYVRV